MLLTTSDLIPGKNISETLGLVRGSTVRTKSVVTDFMAGIKNMVGGEVGGYTKMLADSREQSIQRMLANAEKLGAEAVVGIRFTTSSVMAGAAEILVYGTAVKLAK